VFDNLAYLLPLSWIVYAVYSHVAWLSIKKHAVFSPASFMWYLLFLALSPRLHGDLWRISVTCAWHGTACPLISAYNILAHGAGGRVPSSTPGILAGGMAWRTTARSALLLL